MDQQEEYSFNSTRTARKYRANTLVTGRARTDTEMEPGRLGASVGPSPRAATQGFVAIVAKARSVTY